ncbi:hypothetical protein [Streptococcus bouchesdurhonensis]|uniref:hypothetical protein n=1 Tax=Streptococcus bouchesdurhonensis TaxID=2954240 RepID=UPI0021C337B2|nr:hypothetical protein [Streptococcus bouchesdurhonensis]
MNNIYEEISKKKLNEKLVKSLTPEEQSFWLEWLNESDRHENSYARQCRRKEISLNSKINNGRTNNETTPLDLFIDDSPNPLDFLIQTEDEEFTLAQLPRLKKVLSELDELETLSYFAIHLKNMNIRIGGNLYKLQETFFQRNG